MMNNTKKHIPCHVELYVQNARSNGRNYTNPNIPVEYTKQLLEKGYKIEEITGSTITKIRW